MEATERTIKAVLTLLTHPACKIFTFIKNILDKMLKKSRKTLKKIKNKWKYLLKVDKHLLYNLSVKKRFRVNGSSENEKE